MSDWELDTWTPESILHNINTTVQEASSCLQRLHLLPGIHCSHWQSLSETQTPSLPSDNYKQDHSLVVLPSRCSFHFPLSFPSPQRSGGVAFYKEDCTHLGLAVTTRILHAHRPTPSVPTGAQCERRSQLTYWETSNLFPSLFFPPR